MQANHNEQSTLARELRLVPFSAIENAHNVLPAGAAMKGEMTASTGLSIRIDGTYSGSIALGPGSTIYISKEAVVDAKSIEADMILIEGRITGNVKAREAIELASSALVNGSVTYEGELDIHAGAKIRGQINGPQD